MDRRMWLPMRLSIDWKMKRGAAADPYPMDRGMERMSAKTLFHTQGSRAYGVGRCRWALTAWN